jgi:hypothetical protein
MLPFIFDGHRLGCFDFLVLLLLFAFFPKCLKINTQYHYSQKERRLEKTRAFTGLAVSASALGVHLTHPRINRDQIFLRAQIYLSLSLSKETQTQTHFVLFFFFPVVQRWNIWEFGSKCRIPVATSKFRAICVSETQVAFPGGGGHPGLLPPSLRKLPLCARKREGLGKEQDETLVTT